jgi:hypothetical protein
MTVETQYGRESILAAVASLLTARGVGAILGISVKTVHKLVRQKKLACVQVTSRERKYFGVLCKQNGTLDGSRNIESCPQGWGADE